MSPSVNPSVPAVAPAPHPAIALIEDRISANRFDPAHRLSDADIEDLVQLATRAPSAWNLQNWRFIAVRTPDAKARLRALSYDQPKVTEAAVTFIVCGVLPDPATLPARFAPFIETGHIDRATVAQWQQGADQILADPARARDEALRSATLAAATLMFAASARGFASGPMIGFDAAGVAAAFGLGADEVPVMLVTVGRAAAGNWPQKPRRPVADVMAVV